MTFYDAIVIYVATQVDRLHAAQAPALREDCLGKVHFKAIFDDRITFRQSTATVLF